MQASLERTVRKKHEVNYSKRNLARNFSARDKEFYKPQLAVPISLKTTKARLWSRTVRTAESDKNISQARHRGKTEDQTGASLKEIITKWFLRDVADVIWRRDGESPRYEKMVGAEEKRIVEAASVHAENGLKF